MLKKQNPPVVPKVNVADNERLYFVELNDANMSSFSWEGSRYKGKQLFTTELNNVTASLISGSGSVAGVKYVGPIDVVAGTTGSILVPDKTGYGKTACVQKYSRNIYLGNGIVGLDQGSEDEALLAFEGFSYAQTSTYFTVNGDDTITTNVLSNQKKNFDERRGFYRAFNEDFPETSKCTLIVLDESIKTNLKDNYNIYFNGGQLRKIIALNPTGSEIYDEDGVLTHTSTPGIYDPTGNPVRTPNWSLEYHIVTASNNTNYFNSSPYKENSVILYYRGAGRTQGGSRPAYFNINSDIIDFYSGSLEEEFIAQNLFYEANEPLWETAGGSNITNTTYTENDGARGFFSFAKHVDTFRSKSFQNKNYIDDKRFFVSLIKKGPSTAKSVPFPLRTLTSGSTPELSGSIRTNNLAELSTGEIYDIYQPSPVSQVDYFVVISLRSGSILNQDYNSIRAAESDLQFGLFNHLDAFPADFATGSLCITRCDNSNPSLLLNLPKNDHLKDGIGQRGYVILPENIHPHIKQNLRYYLFKAGVNLGIPLPPAPDNTYKTLM